VNTERVLDYSAAQANFHPSIFISILKNFLMFLIRLVVSVVQLLSYLRIKKEMQDTDPIFLFTKFTAKSVSGYDPF